VSPRPRLAAIILAGGRSTRFGRDKALEPIEGVPLVSRTVHIASQVASSIIVVGAKDQDLPALPDGVVVVRDDQEFAGPLVGLAKGAAELSRDVDAALVLAVDLPRLRRATLDAVIAACPGGGSAVPMLAGRPQPLLALYSRAALDELPALIAEGVRSMKAFVARVPHAQIDEAALLCHAALAAEDPTLDSFRDADTTRDL